jgi:hypothetical protein
MLAEDSKNVRFKIVEEKLSELLAIKVARNALRNGEFAFFHFFVILTVKYNFSLYTVIIKHMDIN